jgi:riboflavin synthase
MFTGIVEAVGAVVRVAHERGVVALEISAREICEGVALGDSIAIDGCCLTVTRTGAQALVFDAVPETLRRTALGERGVGARVNLERAMRADARFGGHIVQGHVDGTGRVERIDRAGADVLVRIGCSELADQIVAKGSITVDGVSLTVAERDEAGFSVALIPHTLAVTTLGERMPGDRVNLELDVLGKYVAAYLARRDADGSLAR